MLPLAAYADRLSVRPGETVAFQVANATGQPVTARVVRVISSDANPAGPGIQVEEIDAQIAKLAEPGPARVARGSYAIVSGLEAWLSGGGFTVSCRLFPTLLDSRRQGLITRMSETLDRGFGLMIDDDGRLLGAMGNGSGFEDVRTPTSLRERCWQIAWLRFDADSRELQIGHARLDSTLTTVADGTLSTTASPALDSPLLMAAANHDAPNAHFNGKLERPMLYDRALSDEEIQSTIRGEDPPGAVACWDFARETSGSRIVDLGSRALHGRLINTPARAMTGARWSGREMCFRHASDEYGAIQFHQDDIDDCEWPTAFQWTVPNATRSSVYALMLSAGEAEENVPFHVVPPKGRATARIAVLASTFTYTIYANHARPEWQRDPEWQAAWRRQSADWGGYPHNPGDHREYGLSTYNVHPDASGISIASAWMVTGTGSPLAVISAPRTLARAAYGTPGIRVPKVISKSETPCTCKGARSEPII